MRRTASLALRVSRGLQTNAKILLANGGNSETIRGLTRRSLPEKR